jgi:hypothetical protein
LTQKASKWKWGEPQQTAFEALKCVVTTAPVLVFPSDTGKFRVEADASNFATGAVLSQLQDDGKWHPVGFISKSLSDVECNQGCPRVILQFSEKLAKIDFYVTLAYR